MSSTKISAMSAATSVNSTSLIPIVLSGNNFSATASQLGAICPTIINLGSPADGSTITFDGSLSSNTYIMSFTGGTGTITLAFTNLKEGQTFNLFTNYPTSPSPFGFTIVPTSQGKFGVFRVDQNIGNFSFVVIGGNVYNLYFNTNTTSMPV
jgi:hypothetical protein